MKRLTCSFLLIFSIFVVSGCTTKTRTHGDPDLPYKVVLDGVNVSTVGEAVQAHNRNMQSSLRGIEPLPEPLIDRSLVVYIPSAASIEAHHDKVDPPAWNKAAQGYRDLWEYMARDGFVTYSKAVEARNIYQSVRVMEFDIPEVPPNPSIDEDVLSLRFHTDSMLSAAYISTVSSGESAIPFDHLKGPVERLSSAVRFLEIYVSR